MSEATLAKEYSTSRTEVPEDLTTWAAEIDKTTEEEIGTTQQSSNVPQRITEVTSEEPKMTSFATTGDGDETTKRSSVSQLPSASGFSTKSTTEELVEATSETTIFQTSETVSTDGVTTNPATKSTIETTSRLTVDSTSQSQSSIGPSTADNIMRVATSQGSARASEPISTMGPSTTETSMFERTPQVIMDNSSEPASTMGPSTISTEMSMFEKQSQAIVDNSSEPASTMGPSTDIYRDIYV